MMQNSCLESEERRRIEETSMQSSCLELGGQELLWEQGRRAVG